MMLLALCCTKCGAKLDFANSLFCNCESCGTPHALVGSGTKGVLHPASYLPLRENKGEMTKNLKLCLVEELRAAGYLVSEYSWYFDPENVVVDSDTKKVSWNSNCDFKIGSSIGEHFYVGTASVIKKKKISLVGFFRKRQVEEWNYQPDVKVVASVLVKTVKVSDGQNEFLAGYRIVMKVPDVELEEQANELSRWIQERFGVVPDVTLEKI